MIVSQYMNKSHFSSPSLFFTEKKHTIKIFRILQSVHFFSHTVHILYYAFATSNPISLKSQIEDHDSPFPVLFQSYFPTLQIKAFQHKYSLSLLL